ncbi:HlyD family type I secretion periplasmic adaptor subunit [Limoniibacter endophyticus]|uniref:Membrane fusion protein (MFP) family protein n=1 Tax=Limoniibacter endophyticus TaxID=1565040 RepID=A0A8J3GHP0_9HYPH|nr:HlyD family type I secretion periplasmic adaptor subunit [Limoniibacter endophyticus]GHC73293.1 secretion protein HlyD [Limoniibacter endophyticus]
MSAARTNEDWVFGDTDDVKLARSSRIIWVTAILLLTLGIWSYFAVLDEVSSGTGKIVPTTREQNIESLEGGILASLHVRQDQIVEPGQVLAQLDPTLTTSELDENAARYRAALASATRLQAEVSDTELNFPEALADFPELVAAEHRLFSARRNSLNETLSWIRQSIELVKSELAINEKLSDIGASSQVEVIRLKRELVELQLKQEEVQSEYIVRAREELAKANAEVAALSSTLRGRTNRLERLTVRSPVRGVVKNIEVSTIGGVIPPNGKLMVIVPLDDQLLVEARISPRDIAFIHPGQRASVKITAYDYAIYGDLDGEVSTISPDTIQDEVDPEIFYYRVFIRTDKDKLVNDAGKEFPITPGMVATADIHTGSKTVLDYLIKPLNRAAEAMRER